ncbi:hypothetical protein KEM55_007961 [Ascosphaera atra]|nr:hypothetical protein KEM55_007961 [Ascosphaera atra]
MAHPQSEEFKKAAAQSSKLKQQPTVEEMLELYAFYKQGCQDPPFNPDNKPGMFDLKAKKKFQAWEAIQTLDPDEAQKKYVEIVERLKEKYGCDE